MARGTDIGGTDLMTAVFVESAEGLGPVRSGRELAGAEPSKWLVGAIRTRSRLLGGVEADRLVMVAQLAEAVTAEVVATLGSVGRLPGVPPDRVFIDCAVTAEVQAVLGIADGAAARLVDLARRLTTVLPRVLAALKDGRLDLARASALAEGTRVLTDTLARQVADTLLNAAGTAPWEGLSPRAWWARVDRAVVKADAAAALRRRGRRTRRGLSACYRASKGWPSCSSTLTPRMWRWPNRS